MHILRLSCLETLLGFLKSTLTFKTSIYSLGYGDHTTKRIIFVSFVKKISTICLKKKLIIIYKTRYKYFRSGIIYVSELTSMWTFKMYSRNTKTTNEPTGSDNKSDRPQVNIWDTWKTLKYLNINDSFHLKDLEISKYKRESKGRWPIKICRFIFVNCCLIWLSKH